MTLDIFTNKVGEGSLVWPHDPEKQGELALSVLDAVQVIADVLVDEGQSYTVGFTADRTASTNYQTRKIAVTAKPLTQGGLTFQQVVDIMAGFVVHEVGHTKTRVSDLIAQTWPGKKVPHKLGNILADVRLEAWMVKRFPGLEGVFDPTFEWVARETIPTEYLFDTPNGTPYTYGDDTTARVNFAGMAARYEPFINWSSDPDTQRHLRWFADQWAGKVNADTTNAELVELVRAALDRIHAHDEPDEGEGEGEGGEGNPEPTEGEGEGEGNGGDGDDTEGEGEGEGSDSEGDTEGEGDDEGEGNGSPTDAPDMGDEDEGEGEGSGTEGEDDGEGNPTEGDGDGEGNPTGDDDTEGDHVSDGQLDEGKTLDRTEIDGEMGDGTGGSGQAITTASGNDDPDDGFDEAKANKDMDDIAEGKEDWQQQHKQEDLDRQVEEERSTTRLTAGIYGKMKVKVSL